MISVFLILALLVISGSSFRLRQNAAENDALILNNGLFSRPIILIARANNPFLFGVCIVLFYVVGYTCAVTALVMAVLGILHSI